MRICLVYDCLFPHTIGGAERWYRNVAGRLAAEGHDVTYLTLRQWPRGDDASFDGVDVVAVGPRLSLYTDSGRRRLVPPLVFGAGVLAHLLLRGGRYDVVQTVSFPYFSVLAAALAGVVHRFRLVVDWFEVWTREYWREYLGPAGVVGWLVQRVCARVPQRALCVSRMHAERLRAEGLRGEVTMVEGLYSGGSERPQPLPAEPLVVFAGRHIPEKRVPAIVPALARARREAPELRALLLGDGPDRDEVLRLIAAEGLGDVVDAPGFVEADQVEQALARALCLVLPSRREGYGLVVIEAAAHGTPSVVVADPDNAATELVEEGVNGFVAPSASAEHLAAAILAVRGQGPALRASTADWFAGNAERLSLERSLEVVSQSYSA